MALAQKMVKSEKFKQHQKLFQHGNFFWVYFEKIKSNNNNLRSGINLKI
jgi:hypothetical protein